MSSKFNNKLQVTETQIRQALRKWCIIDLIQDEVIKELTSVQVKDNLIVHTFKQGDDDHYCLNTKCSECKFDCKFN